MIKRTNNIARNLPKVTNTGNQLLNTWLSAATEIINDIKSRLTKLEAGTGSNSNNKAQSIIGSSTSLSGYELIQNKVNTILDGVSDENQYPTVIAVVDFFNKYNVGTSNSLTYEFDTWQIESENFEDLGANKGDKFEISGNGSYLGIDLRNGDIVEVYADDDEEIGIFKTVDSRTLLKGIATSDDIIEGDNHKFFWDAPKDDKNYGRKNGDWSEIVKIALSLPLNRHDGTQLNIPLTSNYELPFYLSDGSQSNISMVSI